MSGSVDLGGRRIIKKIFFKQKTAYEIVTGDWSSDVCSSDLCDKFFSGFDLSSIIIPSSGELFFIYIKTNQIGRASCRERV